MSISAVVHTYNEAYHITACIASLAFADEVVVVDNGSSDNTVALAQAAGARVVHFAGQYGYPEPARVFGLTQLTKDWVLILDADERATPELAQELRQWAKSPAAKAGYWIPIKNFHFGQWLRYGGLYPDLHMRFFKRHLGSYPEVGLHRGIVVSGETSRVQGDILHYSYRDIAHYFEKFNTYTTVEAERIVEQQRIPTGYTLLIKPLHRWFKAYITQGGFRDGLPGFLFHLFSAAYVFTSEVKAWERYREKGQSVNVAMTLFKRHATLKKP